MITWSDFKGCLWILSCHNLSWTLFVEAAWRFFFFVCKRFWVNFSSRNPRCKNTSTSGITQSLRHNSWPDCGSIPTHQSHRQIRTHPRAPAASPLSPQTACPLCSSFYFPALEFGCQENVANGFVRKFVPNSESGPQFIQLFFFVSI